MMKKFNNLVEAYRTYKGYISCMYNEDDEKIADKFLQKLMKLRIFADENGKTNLSIQDVGGALLLVSQFTLMANCWDGNRPSFTNAQKPDRANELYEYIIAKAKETGIDIQTGEFGADMQVSLVNDGPVTIILDTKNR